MSDSPARFYEFGPFRLDARRCLLLREGEPVALSPKVFETLLVLVESRGRVVRKDELLERIWPDIFVEEGNLTQNVFVLRKALGEGPNDHRYIVTVPGRGYRFVAEVREIFAPEEASAAPPREPEPPAERPAEDPEAFRAYIKGRYFWNKRTPEGLRKGIEYAQQAIAIDPTYARAYVGVADCYSLLAGHGGLAPRETFPKARAAALAALEIDPAMAEAHASLGFVNYRYEWDWPAAEQDFRRAIELKPGYATAHHWYGEALAAAARFDESLAELRRAQEIDPLSLPINTDLAQSLYFARRYEESAEQLRKTLEMDDGFVRALVIYGAALEQLGRYAEAVFVLRRAAELSEGSSLASSGLAHVYAVSGHADRAREILRGLEQLAGERYVSSYSLAVIHAGLSEHARALDLLERAVADRDVWLVWLKVNPRLDPLRADARFDALLRRVGLTERD